MFARRKLVAPRLGWIGVTLASALLAVVAGELASPARAEDFRVSFVLLNAIAFTAVVCIVNLFTNRTVFSTALVTVLFGGLVVANRLKIRYLLTPIHPADLFSLPEALRVPLFGANNEAALLGCIVALAASVALFRIRAFRVSGRDRLLAGVASIALLSVFIVASRIPIVGDLLREGGRLYDPNLAMEQARNGILVDFLLRVGDLYVERPAEYDEASARRALKELATEHLQKAADDHQRPVNLIILMVEAMMDPSDLGLQLTSDPVPFFNDLRRRYSSGWGYSPEAGGRSANPEFELLTGFGTFFLPPETIAFVSYVNRPLPSLPRLLSGRGYHSSALHVDTLAFFNYLNVYRNLGFNDASTLSSNPNVPISANGRGPSDEALVDSIIERSREKRSPYFVFAFTNATHLPYDYPAYLNSPLDVIDPLPKDAHNEVKTYINALRDADRAIEKLVRSFERTEDPVVIAVLGDHLPGLSLPALRRARMFGAKNLVDGLAFAHRCPVVIWSNFDSPKRDFELSFNFLAQRIVQEMGIGAPAYWRANMSLARSTPVLSKFIQIADGRRFPPGDTPRPEYELIRKFGLVQYDLMFGSQYLKAAVN